MEAADVRVPLAGAQASLRGVGAASAGTLMWGFSGILVALTTQPALVVAMERMALGIPLVGAIVVINRCRLTWQVLWQSVPGGLLLCGDIAMFYSAVKLTSIADATVIGALQPALVLFVARPLFGEHINLSQVFWTMVAILGVCAVVTGAGATGSDPLLGDGLAVGSLCCWTGYWLVSKYARTARVGHLGVGLGALGSVQYTTSVMLVAAIAVVPVTLLSGERLTWGTPSDWLWMGLLALGPGSAHLLLNWAHSTVSVSISSVIVSANPVVAAGAAVVFLGQQLDTVQVVGGLAALVAVTMVARRALWRGRLMF